MLTTRILRPFTNVSARHPRFKERKNAIRLALPLVTPGERRFYSGQQEQVAGKGVLVTGCDSGFGFSVAKHLHSKGFTVFAGCLLKDKGHDGIKELDDMKSNRMKTVQLNVCKEGEVQHAVEFIRASLKDPEKGLWGLVNNAGISTFGEVEFTSMDTYQEVAEVNLWGTIRVTKACLPLLRRAKEKKMKTWKRGKKKIRHPKTILTGRPQQVAPGSCGSGQGRPPTPVKRKGINGISPVKREAREDSVAHPGLPLELHETPRDNGYSLNARVLDNRFAEYGLKEGT